MSTSNQKIMPGAEPFLFQGNKIGCLLIHGFTGTPREMRLLGEYLHNSGLTVLGIRLAGHASNPADMVRSRWEDWLLSVEEGIHILRNCCQSVFLIGLSMGGMLSLIAASQFPVNGVIALSTPFKLPEDWRLTFVNLFKFISPQVGKGKDDWHNPENGHGHISYSAYPTASIAELVKVVNKMHESSPKIQIPALLIQSKNDATVPPEHIQMHFNEIGSHEKHLLLIEKSGHIITRDTDREIVFESIVSFIHNISTK